VPDMVCVLQMHETTNAQHKQQYSLPNLRFIAQVQCCVERATARHGSAQRGAEVAGTRRGSALLLASKHRAIVVAACLHAIGVAKVVWTSPSRRKAGQHGVITACHSLSQLIILLLTADKGRCVIDTRTGQPTLGAGEKGAKVHHANRDRSCFELTTPAGIGAATDGGVRVPQAPNSRVLRNSFIAQDQHSLRKTSVP
jgi:hypothetical protein